MNGIGVSLLPYSLRVKGNPLWDKLQDLQLWLRSLLGHSQPGNALRCWLSVRHSAGLWGLTEHELTRRQDVETMEASG
jgi:hypothetical protein